MKDEDKRQGRGWHTHSTPPPPPPPPHSSTSHVLTAPYPVIGTWRHSLRLVWRLFLRLFCVVFASCLRLACALFAPVLRLLLQFIACAFSHHV